MPGPGVAAGEAELPQADIAAPAALATLRATGEVVAEVVDLGVASEDADLVAEEA